MARPVRVTTPVPTLEEFGENLGLSKARQKSLNPIFVERRPQGDYSIRRRGSERPAMSYPRREKQSTERVRLALTGQYSSSVSATLLVVVKTNGARSS